MNTFAKIVRSVWWPVFWLAYSFTFLIIGSFPLFWLFMVGFWSAILGGRLYMAYDRYQHRKYLEARYIRVPNNQESE